MSSRKSSFFCLFLWYFFTYFTSSLIALLTHCLPITDEVSIKSVMIRQYALREDVLTLNRFFCDCNYILTRWSFDSKPILAVFATRFWANRKFYSLPSTFKAEARFRVKTKIRSEVTISEQFQSNLLKWKNTFFHDGGIWGKAEARFRVKTKVPSEAANYEQFLPHISGAAEYIFFPWP